MSLQRRTLLILGAAMVALVLALWYATDGIVASSFSRLERRAVEQDLKRVSDAVEAQKADLMSTASNWAPWDDSWHFVQDRDQAYVDANLGRKTLSNLDVDVMAFLDAEGRVVHVALADRPGASAKGSEHELRAYLESEDPALLTDPPAQRARSGIVSIEGNVPLALATHAIRKSDFSGPTAGVLVVGRFLAPAQIAEIGRSTHLSVTSQAPTAEAMERAGLATGADTSVRVLGEDKVAGYSIVRDTSRRPALLLETTVSRDVFQTGERTLDLFLVSLVAVAVSALALILLVLSRLVIYPVAKLSRRVGQIGESGDMSQRVWVHSSDELGKLGSAINVMLTALQRSEMELLAARDQLERRVERRTFELERTVTALRTEVHERSRAEEALRDSEQRYRALVQSMADAVFTLDGAGFLTFVNTRAESLTGHTAAQLMGKPLQELLTADSAAIMRRKLRRSSSLRSENLEVELIDARGKIVPVELSLATLLGKDGEPAGMQAVARDITERKRFEAELLYMASHDYLTGLYNRRRFEEELERELAQARRHDRRGAIIWLDLDHFKEVNDSLGHRAGDEILIALGDALGRRVREEDVLSRLGGDEFGVLMPMADGREAQVAARRLLEELRSQAIVVAGHPVHMAASAGIVLYPDQGTTVEELLARADLAMYHAKETGRGRYSVYLASDEWHSELAERRSWAERIDEALTLDSLVVFAQPIIELATGEASRYELLVRMTAEDGSLVPPDQFLGAAERLGLVNDIDRWMLERAVAIIAERAEHGDELRLDLNLSARALNDSHFLRSIEALLKQSGIDPTLLGFEITETAIISDINRAQEFVRVLKSLGCRFSLDDFGSGFSSFYHLKHLPIDHLKIDGTFIQNLPVNPADQHLVRAMVEMARGLGMRTTAEYVEDGETLELLRTYGVDYAQGFHVGRPGPVLDVLQRRAGRLEGSIGA